MFLWKTVLSSRHWTGNASHVLGILFHPSHVIWNSMKSCDNQLSVPWSRSKGGQTRNEQIPWNLMNCCGLVMAFTRLLEVDLAGLMSKLEQFFLKVCMCVCLCTWRLEDDVVRCHALSHLSTLFPWGDILTEPGAHGVLSRLVAGKLQQCSCLHFSPASQGWDYRHVLSLAWLFIWVLRIRSQGLMFSRKSGFAHWTIPQPLKCRLFWILKFLVVFIINMRMAQST